MMDKDGSGQRQVTVDSHNDLFPAVSADGRFIFFASDRAGAFNIWRVRIDGSDATQLTRGANQILPETSPDGDWVYYQQGIALEEPDIWRVPAAGGSPQLLIDTFSLRPVASPDGGRLAYVYLDEKEWGIAVRGLEPAAASIKFPFPSTVVSRVFRWTPDSRSLAYIASENGASNIWQQPLSGGSASQLTHFKAGQILSFAWSPDGQFLALMRRRATSDVVMLRNFR